MNIRNPWFIATTLALSVIGGIGAALWLADGDGTARAVELRNNGQLVGFVPKQEALNAASERVGFEVREMRDLPPGFELVGVDSNSGPPGLPNPLKIAMLIYASGEDSDSERTTIRVEQTGIRSPRRTAPNGSTLASPGRRPSSRKQRWPTAIGCSPRTAASQSACSGRSWTGPRCFPRSGRWPTNQAARRTRFARSLVLR